MNKPNSDQLAHAWAHGYDYAVKQLPLTRELYNDDHLRDAYANGWYYAKKKMDKGEL